ncbi:hypothetical protein [Methanimicrococcus hongohii]|uniref:hypothetical protein n=1 Tax=Methanimicrococcus hongohii TaxID=3028295 RepID=UPI002931347F|nr:hypothetical protein [Methanimicrococcus sp. Hf6]
MLGSGKCFLATVFTDVGSLLSLPICNCLLICVAVNLVSAVGQVCVCRCCCLAVSARQLPPRALLHFSKK